MPASYSDLSARAGASSQQRKGLEAYLRTRSHDELVDLLLAAAVDDEKLDHRLSLTAAEASNDVALLAEQVDAVLERPGWLDYRGAIDYASAGRDLVDALLKAAASPANDHGEVTWIVEDAITHVASALRRADDSSGDVGDLADGLLAVHVNACRRAHHDPIALAHWLVRFTFDDNAFVTIEIRNYARVLRKPGLAAYRAAIIQRLVDAPDDHCVRLAAERLAVFDRDPDAVIRLFGGDLDSAPQI